MGTAPQSAQTNRALAEIHPRWPNRGLVNLVSSLIEFCGVRPRHPGLSYRELQSQLQTSDSVVLCVIDGLGYQFLLSQPDLQMAQDCRLPLESVFPPTTGAAIPTFVSGVLPAEHGMLGWYSIDPNHSEVFAALPHRRRGVSGVAPQRELADYISQPTPLKRCSGDWALVMSSAIVDSAFNQVMMPDAAYIPADTLEQWVAAIIEQVNAPKAPRVIYAYWSEYDSLAHEEGFDSALCKQHLQRVDQAYQQIKAALENTKATLLLTADHGFINVPDENWFDLEHYPRLLDALEAPLWAEPRAALCRVKKSCQAQFADWVWEDLGEKFVAVHATEVLNRRVFGDALAHPELQARIGDFLILAVGHYALADRVGQERTKRMLGMHGGIDRAEREIPLVIAQKPST